MRRLLEACDNILAKHGPGSLCTQPNLLILAIHSVWKGQVLGQDDRMHPQQRLTLEELRHTLESFRDFGRQFVSPEQIAQGLPLAGRYCLLTFDDGYRNNLDALPLLQEFAAPAIFFVVPYNIETGESYWWDAVYRKGRARGTHPDHINRYIEDVKRSPLGVRAALLNSGFSKSDFRPIGDLDRPLNRSELAGLGQMGMITIGNHTWGHEILTRCTPEVRCDSLSKAQHYLTEVCGVAPQWVAYPNGDQDVAVRNDARTVGLHWGVTLDENTHTLPLSTEHRMRIGRCLLWGGQDMRLQVQRLSLSFSVTRLARSFRRNHVRRLLVHSISNQSDVS